MAPESLHQASSFTSDLEELQVDRKASTLFAYGPLRAVDGTSEGKLEGIIESEWPSPLAFCMFPMYFGSAGRTRTYNPSVNKGILAMPPVAIKLH